MIDILLTNDNDITFATVNDTDCIRQLIYHSIMTKFGELIRDPEYGNMMYGKRIKQYTSGINTILTDCAMAIRTCKFVRSILRANIKTTSTGYQLSYTVSTKDGGSVSDILDITTQ